MSDDGGTPRAPTTSEWTSIGIRFFSWAAGIALVLAAVFLYRSSGGHPWLRAGLGLGAGVALVVAGITLQKFTTGLSAGAPPAG